MLFDLRGRGRRRTVQVIYIGLALLFLVGFVGLGVGVGGGGGGILNAFTGESGAPKASFAGQVKKYQKLVAEQPKSVSAWEGLTTAQLHEAGGEAYVSNGKLTSKGKELFTQIAQSWNSYLALNPPKPNPELAQEMERIFGEEGLNQPTEEVKVLQVVIAVKPELTPQYESSLYASMAEYAYKAHNTRIGDLASEKAIGLAAPAERAKLKKALAELKKSAASTSTSPATSTGAASVGGAAGSAGTVSTSGASGGSSGTVTIGGKTYPIQTSTGGAAGTSTAAK
jgi:hypothetical protein